MRRQHALHGHRHLILLMNEKLALQSPVHAEVADLHPSRNVGLGLPPAPELSPEEEARLWRKIDLRILPMLSLMYLMSFLDRGVHR
jgi:hypothetical protein